MTQFFEDLTVRSWGRVVKTDHWVARPTFRDELGTCLKEAGKLQNGVLPIGLRRSYGDSGLNAHGGLIDMSRVDRLISFDDEKGVLHAEAGASLAEVLRAAIPRGFFLPVTPGTKIVTLGGAIANDVHGKNHSRNGTFGGWVRAIGLLRSDGAHVRLTPDDETGLFAATIGGLGLTGIITDVAIALRPIRSSNLAVETISFGNVSEFFSLTRESLKSWEHTVAWIDCLAGGVRLGRGIFSRANHAETGPLAVSGKRRPQIPFDLPELALNKISVLAFNALYYHSNKARSGVSQISYEKLFYPLDGFANWNRLYGRRGMYQYQSVVPPESAEAATVEMLRTISQAGQGSFLVVLKTFGSRKSPGMLSFPKEGTTLAVDFPNRGKATIALLDRLDTIVRAAGGRLYPAKDGRLPKDIFVDGFPRLDQFSAHVDPALSSSFWRRMQ